MQGCVCGRCGWVRCCREGFSAGFRSCVSFTPLLSSESKGYSGITFFFFFFTFLAAVSKCSPRSKSKKGFPASLYFCAGMSGGQRPCPRASREAIPPKAGAWLSCQSWECLAQENYYSQRTSSVHGWIKTVKAPKVGWYGNLIPPNRSVAQLDCLLSHFKYNCVNIGWELPAQLLPPVNILVGLGGQEYRQSYGRKLLRKI